MNVTTRLASPSRALSLLAVIVTGCGSPHTESTDSVAPLDATTDTATDTVTDTQTGPGHLAWSQGSTLVTAVNHHQTFIVESSQQDYLYVAGGFNGSASTRNIQRSAIQTDGTLAPWERSGMLPAAIGGAGVVVTHGEVIMAGGMTNIAVATTYTSPIAADGSLGAWTRGPDLPGPRFHTCMVVHGDVLYDFGGLDSNSASVDDVASATIASDGTVGAWTTIAHLPLPTSHHGCALVGDYIYITGGITQTVSDQNGAIYNQVYATHVSDDGSLGPFMPQPSLPEHVGTHSSFAVNGYLYVAGGVASDTALAVDSSVTDGIFRAQIGADGTLGTWEDTGTPLLIAKSHAHQMPMLHGIIYSAGGAAGDITSPVNEVEIGTGL